MSFAILGSGAIGRALATRFARAEIDVSIATRGGPSAAAELARELGPHVAAAAMKDALQADIVLLAIPFTSIRDAVSEAPPWQGRIVVDATNAIDFPAFTPTDLGGRPSTEVVADAVPAARVVKAFNTLPAATLGAEPARDGARRILFLSGNDAAANADVAALIRRLGFAAIDLGRLDGGGLLQQFAGPLTNKNAFLRDVDDV
jgi:8-hydroxy-5-deazaflavin:NADPH oxidoreductase